jgi:azobenzene reductase
MARILLISGSPRHSSHTFALTQEMALWLQKYGCSVTVFDLAETPIPLMDPAYEVNPSDYPNDSLQRFISLAENADGFVLGTPTYHNSYSGCLKNALDWLGETHFRYKPVALMCNSGGMRSVQALDHLRIVVRELSGIAIPRQIATSDADFDSHDKTLQCQSELIRDRIRLAAQELFMFIRAATLLG